MRLQQLLFLLFPVLFSSASGSRRQSRLGRRWGGRQVRILSPFSLTELVTQVVPGARERETFLCIPEGCAWKNVMTPTPSNHHPLQLIFTEHPVAWDSEPQTLLWFWLICTLKSTQTVETHLFPFPVTLGEISAFFIQVWNPIKHRKQRKLLSL